MAELKTLADIKVYSVEDRSTIAAILVRNGYCVSQLKKLREGTKNAYDFYIRIREDSEALQTTR